MRLANGRRVSFWQGQFLDHVLGLSTRTAGARANAIPRLALASASSAYKTVYIHPELLGEFILTHNQSEFVCHDVAASYWVVAKHLTSRGESEALELWQKLADDDRMHDTMLLDELIRLARSDAPPRPRSPAEVAAEYAGFAVSESDPLRHRFGEIVGRSWTDVDPAFFAHAAEDAIAALQNFNNMYPEATCADGEHVGNYVPVENAYGLLTETIEVKGAIALAAIERRGIRLDVRWVNALKAELRQRVDGLIADLGSSRRWRS